MTRIEPSLRSKLDALYDEAHEIWARFDVEVRRKAFHPFVPADYDSVEATLLEYRGRNLRFLEWGSATGAITIMADLLGFESYGIEIDARLVDIARELAAKYQSKARFAAGSFLPTGYEYRSPTGDWRTGTIEHGPSGYQQLGLALEDFDLIFGYPWSGEDGVMLDLFEAYGGPDALLLLNTSKGCHPIQHPRHGK
jgi:hypothetical protein